MPSASVPPLSPRNIALRDLVVPTRAFPHDTLNVTGYLQANGYAGPIGRRRAHPPPLARQSRRRHARSPRKHVTLGPDGEMVPVSFDLEPSEPGTFVFQASRQSAAPTTATRATTSAKPKSKSSIAKLASCSSPAARCATTSSFAINCIATPR